MVDSNKATAPDTLPPIVQPESSARSVIVSTSGLSANERGNQVASGSNRSGRLLNQDNITGALLLAFSIFRLLRGDRRRDVPS